MEASESDKIYVNQLIVNFLSGEITPEEMTELEHLLKTDSDNRQLFRDIKKSWDMAGTYISDHSPANLQESWLKIKTMLDSDSTHKKSNPRQLILKPFQVAALIISLISVSSLSTWYFIKLSSKTAKANLCSIKIPLGSKSYMVLPDGSEVWLNAGTTIQYPNIFSANQRDIYLAGEAYFKVKSDKKWPFVVHTTELNIRALGTSFNVKAYPNEKMVTTTLVEGIVKLENDKQKFSYTLKPKQELVFTKEATKEIPQPDKEKPQIISEPEQVTKPQASVEVIINSEVNTELKTSWKDSRWIIQGETVENLAILLERRYDIKINIVSEELKPFKFSGIIANETIEQVLKYLAYTVPLSYKIDKGFVNLEIDKSLIEKYKLFLKKKER